MLIETNPSLVLGIRDLDRSMEQDEHFRNARSRD